MIASNRNRRNEVIGRWFTLKDRAIDQRNEPPMESACGRGALRKKSS